MILIQQKPSNDQFKKDKTLKGKIAEGFEIANSRIPRFYTTPKIHKAGNPGRPEVSLINSPTSKLLEFVDFHLHPIATEVPSHLLDTEDSLNKIKTISNGPQET